MIKIVKLGVLIALSFVASISFGQIKIGNNAASLDARAILELETTTKAIYLPRLTTVQRNSQSGWKAGMFIYNSTLSCVQFFDGTVWACLASVSGTPDLDGDATNELNTGFTLNGTGDSLLLTDDGGTLAVSIADLVDATGLSNIISINSQAISDSAAVIRSLIEDHILADLDTDSTNEYNTGFAMNGTGDSLIITDVGTRYAVAVDNILDTTSLSNRINLNLDSINLNEQAIIDTASTIRTTLNEKVNISDTASMLLPYLLEADQIDTTSLSNRINNNLDSINLNEQAIIDTASTIRTTLNEKVNISDTASMLLPYLLEADQIDTASLSNRINTKVNISDTAAMLLPYLLEADQIDTASLSNRINANLDSINLNEQAIIDTAINIRGYLSDTALLIRSLIVGHIAADADTDPTNERNTGFAVVGTNIRITDAGGNLDVPLSDIIDTTSLSNRVDAKLNISDTAAMLSPYLKEADEIDTISLSNRIDAVKSDLDDHISDDDDTDSGNELITNVSLVVDSFTIVESGDTFVVKLPFAPTYLCKEENGVILTYRLKEVGNVYVNEIDPSITKPLLELLDSSFTTCESGQSTAELTDCKRRERMSDNSSVIVFFNDSADVYSTAGVLTSYSDYDTWFATAGLTVSSVLNCFDEVCLQIGNVQYVDSDGDNTYENIDNSADARSYSTLISQSAAACTPISCQQVYGPSDFGIDGVSGLPDTDPTCTDLSATWFDATTGQLFSWDVIGSVWLSQPSVNTVACPQGAFSATGTILSSIGVSSITKSGTGRYKVNLSVPQPNTDYVILLTKEEGVGKRDALHIDVKEGSKTATSFEVLLTEGDNGTRANSYVDRNWYFSIPCSENFSTGLDSIGLTGDTLRIYEADTSFSVILTDLDSTNELIDSMKYVGDSLYIYEGGESIAAYIPKGEWEDGDSISIAGLVYAKQALANSDTLVITDNAQIGVGLSVPTEDVDVANTIRLRNVDTTSLSDTLLVLDSIGVVKKLAIGDAIHNMTERFDAVGGQLVDANGVTVKLNTSSFEDTYYSSTDSTIMVDKDGRYKITYRVTLEMGSGNNRSTAEHYLLNNGVEIPGSYAGTYHRNRGASTTTGTVVKIVQLTAGDVIKVHSEQSSGSGVLNTKANGSAILIEYLKK
jgi:hypothetical protein